jgi:hypothetical protein
MWVKNLLRGIDKSFYRLFVTLNAACYFYFVLNHRVDFISKIVNQH